MPSHDEHTLSLQRILSIRAEGFSQLRALADRVAQIGTAIETLDAALMTVQSDRSGDEQQALVTATRALAQLLAVQS